jgi:type IV fimbrial biogenesis protein FimT
MTADCRLTPRRAAPGHTRGFTFVELMVTLTIAAILAAVAAPSIFGFVASARLKTYTADLEGSLLLARSEARKRAGARVVVCKSADAANCTTSGAWQQGWIVFVDSNDSATVDSGEPIIEKVAPLAGEFLLRGDSSVSDYISFTKDGSAKLQGSDTTAQTGTLTLCQLAGGAARQVAVLATGRISVGKEPVTSCV